MLKYLALIPTLIIGGPVTTTVAGYLSNETIGFYNVYLLFLVVVVADLLGDIFYFLIGKFAGAKVLEKLFTWQKISKERILHLQTYFNKYGGFSITLGKIIPNFGWPIIVLAGTLKINFFRFILYIMPISLIKSAVLIAVGYYFGQNSGFVYDYVWFLVIPLALYLIFRFFKFKK